MSSTKAGKEPPGVGGPTMLDLYGITGIPTDPRFAGGLTEQGVTGWTTWGRQNSNPQFQDPSVFNPRINYSWIRGRQSFKTGYEYQAINTQIDDFNPKYGRDSYGGQFSRPLDGGSRPGDLQPRRLHVRAAQRLLDHQPVHRQPPPADALRLSAGRLQGDRSADAEPRAAL